MFCSLVDAVMGEHYLTKLKLNAKYKYVNVLTPSQLYYKHKLDLSIQRLFTRTLNIPLRVFFDKDLCSTIFSEAGGEPAPTQRSFQVKTMWLKT
jgi:hypothetical protein